MKSFYIFLILNYSSLKMECINRVLSLILSSSEIIVSVLATPSMSSISKIISLACVVCFALILQKILYFPAVIYAMVMLGINSKSLITCFVFYVLSY